MPRPPKARFGTNRPSISALDGSVTKLVVDLPMRMRAIATTITIGGSATTSATTVAIVTTFTTTGGALRHM